MEPVEPSASDILVKPSVAWHDGEWIETDRVRLSIFDAAVTHAATAVDRIRMYNGRPFELARHLDRWDRTVEHLGIVGLPDRRELMRIIDAVLEKNRLRAMAWKDLGILMIASPGRPDAKSPTLIIALQSIDGSTCWKRLEHGTPLFVSSIRQPPKDCWPRDIKVRSRLHYYLADAEARRKDPQALAVLTDVDGSITETSIANVLAVQQNQLVSPPREQILFGVSLSVAQSLAEECGLTWIESTLTPDQLRDADEVLLTGSSCGIWFANRVDEQRKPSPGPVFRALRGAFDRYIAASR